MNEVQEDPTNGTVFNPEFPVGADFLWFIPNDANFLLQSTCPYVTSVGATQIKVGSTVNDPEEACETVIFSGGGFSNIFPSACSHFDNYDSDKLTRFDNSGYLNSRKVLLKAIRRNI